MRPIRRKSISQETSEHDWLHTVHKKKRDRSYDLGVKAINVLRKEGQNISYKTVAVKTKEIDPEGKGIHPNTIVNNKELHDYYLQYSTSKAYRPRKRANKPSLENLNAFKQIKPDRDLERVRQRYMQFTKTALVKMIIQMEQYIAQQNQIWLRKEFEKFQIEE